MLLIRGDCAADDCINEPNDGGRRAGGALPVTDGMRLRILATRSSLFSSLQIAAAFACALGAVAIYVASLAESTDSFARGPAAAATVAPKSLASTAVPRATYQYVPVNWDEPAAPPKAQSQPAAALAPPANVAAPPEAPLRAPPAAAPPAKAESAPPVPPPSRANETLPVAPPRTEQVQLPVGDPALADKIQLTRTSDRISLTVRDAPLSAVLGLVAKQHGLNIITGDDASQSVSLTLENVPLETALDAVLSVHGYTWSMQQNILVVSKLDATKKSGPMIQGRLVRVFGLNYVSATDVDKIVKGLLSPVGQSFIVLASPTDQRRTSEQIVVEDVPHYMQRIEDYIREIDQPPKQVIVEAHVLQISLKDDCRHGVNFDQLLRLGKAGLTLETKGFASETASPATTLRLDGGDLNFLIEALKTTTDAKTLASPKVTVLNGQEARIQVGGQIGYKVTTTTQTSTMESVNFLDVGVILRVTPIITEDGQVLLSVKPQVSEGGISATTNLPESKTTEVETKIMLADGEAIVIGGLIKETDVETQHRTAYLSDIPYLGRLFQRRTVNRERNEIIITLVPRIVPCTPFCRQYNPQEIERAHTPLLTGPLHRVERTAWEPRFRDAINRPGCPPPPLEPFGPPPHCEVGPPTITPIEGLPPVQPTGPIQAAGPPPAVVYPNEPDAPAYIPPPPLEQSSRRQSSYAPSADAASQRDAGERSQRLPAH